MVIVYTGQKCPVCTINLYLLGELMAQTEIRKAQMVVIPERDRRFVQTPHAAIDNPDYREKNQCPTMLLTYIVRHVVRAHMRDGLNLYHNYYKKNYLVCSMTQPHMARAFNVSERTIRRWLNSLVEDEVLLIDKIHVNGFKKQNVYIVGTHNNVDSCLFLEEVYTKKAVKNTGQK